MEMNIVSRNWVDENSGHHLTDKAWKYSRPNASDTDLDLLTLDASINEIPSVVVAITSTALEREVITSMRDHVIWARTSRVDDVTTFTIPRFFGSKGYGYQMIVDQMVAARESGVSQDEYRLFLPIVHETQYMARFSMRSLHTLHHEFDRLADSAQCSSAAMMFREASTRVDDVLEAMGINHTACKYRDILPAPSYFEDGRVARANSIVSCQITMPFSLRTHLVRHRNLKISDGLRAFCCSSSLPSMNLNTKIEVEVAGTDQDWMSVLSKRNCWMAHQGLWAPLVNTLYPELSLQASLPCYDGACPFEADAYARIKGEDPGAPCPEFSRLSGIMPTEEEKDRMIKTVVDEKRSTNWTTAICELETKE
jgi:hypothetical protein